LTTPLRSLVKLSVSIVLMLAFLYWAFKDINGAEMWEVVIGLSPAWVAAIVLTTLLTLVLRAWRWIVLMRPFAHIPWWDATLALAICYSANVVVPRSGEAVRALSLRWTRGASITSVIATVVVERVIDMIWLIVLVGASLLLLRNRINEAFPLLEPLCLVALAGCLLFLIFLALISIYRERALQAVEHLVARISPSLATRVSQLLGTFVHGLEALHRPSAYLELIAASILLNVGYILIIYESFAAFGFEQTYGLGAVASLVVMAISSIGVVFPTPGGTGSYHLFFGRGLHMVFDVPMAAAMGCATAVHAIATLTYLILGGPAMVIQRRAYKKRTEPSGTS
jgi:uncharacterized protein (TIRG00374 family)